MHIIMLIIFVAFILAMQVLEITRIKKMNYGLTNKYNYWKHGRSKYVR